MAGTSQVEGVAAKMHCCHRLRVSERVLPYAMKRKICKVASRKETKLVNIIAEVL